MGSTFAAHLHASLNNLRRMYIMKMGKVNRNLPIPGLPDKSTMEVTWQGLPLTLKIHPDSSKGTPVFFDQERCGRCYQVKDGEIYTIRLGIHGGDPNGIGTISRDSSVVCAIPTKSGKQLNVTAIFSIAEIYSAVVMDRVSLKADTAFHLEYVYRSAMLESNNGLKGLVLRDDSVRLKDDSILIGHYCLEGEIPDYCTYTYDFITVQVKVVFDDASSDIAQENTC